ncbi:ribose-phosphate diphosphokinase [Candidatus Dojkabacteria bacterium]|nr:ribose-phosphate diphosphokinase [Candidatus Dojkabacteria bacterium]
MELLLVIDALHRQGITDIKAIIPWLCYSPQDKVFRPGEPLSSAVIARILSNSGLKAVYVLDIHNESVCDFFDIPIRNLIPIEVFADALLPDINEDYLCVALDKGSFKRTEKLADALGLDLLKLYKRRDLHSGEIDYEKLKTDLKGKTTVAIDDYTGSGSTVIKSAEMLKTNGAQKCVYCVSHMFDNGVADLLLDSKVDRLLTTKASISEEKVPASDGLISVLDVSPVFAKFMRD